MNDPTPYAGGAVMYTLTLSNQGPEDTTEVVVSDLLPAEVTFVSSSGAGAYDSVTGNWTLSSLDDGDSAVLTILATVDAAPVGTVVSNRAELMEMLANDPDSTPGNGVPAEDDEDSVDFTVSPAPQVDVELVKSVNLPEVGLGDDIAYTIQLTNNGPEPVAGGTVTDVLPTELDFQTFSTDPIGNGTYDPVSGEWLFGPLGVGETTTLQINATLLDLGAADADQRDEYGDGRRRRPPTMLMRPTTATMPRSPSREGRPLADQDRQRCRDGDDRDPRRRRRSRSP